MVVITGANTGIGNHINPLRQLNGKLAGKVVLITGANTGIGYHMALEAAKR